MKKMLFGENMLREISKYESLNKKSNFEAYTAAENISDKARKKIELFEEGKADIIPEDAKAMALYIERFDNRDVLLDILQEKTDINVRAFLHNRKQNWRLRLFAPRSNGYIYLNSKELLNRIRIAEKLDHKPLASRTYSDYEKRHAIIYEAEKYMNLFVEDKITIKPEDYRTFRTYLEEAFPTQNRYAHLDEAIQKINMIIKNEESKQPTVVNMPKHREKSKSWFSKLYNKAKDKIKNLFKREKTAPKKKNTIQFSNAKSTIKRYWKVASVIALFSTGATLSLKSDTSSELKNDSTIKGKTEIKAAKNTVITGNNNVLSWADAVKSYETNQDETTQWMSVADMMENGEKTNANSTVDATSPTNSNDTEPQVKTPQTKPAKTKVQTSVNDNNSQDSYEKIWNNYYDTTLDILVSSAKKAKIYEKIEEQLEKGIFELPEGVSKEKFAYTYQIYKEYGLSSSLEKALNGDQKISDKAQQDIVKDITAAGDKGLGVKSMAQSKHKKLSSYSHYNKASKGLQKAHVKNLKELKQLKKRMANAR